MSAHGTEWIGSGRASTALLRRAGLAAASDVPLLVLGESGTGKEVLARWVHARSRRGRRPMLAVNAAALPAHLLESELFGHERGAFTGADRTHEGLFQAADGGTLLVDEIGDLPLVLQAKLLRVLQEGEVRPVGRTRAVPIDVRILCATHRDLPSLVREGRFREDLWYRISVFTLEVPPLRTRPEDVVALARHFLARHGGPEPPDLSEASVAALRSHGWPGNVRELENAMRHALVLCGHDGPRLQAAVVEPSHLPLAVRFPAASGAAAGGTSIWEVRAAAERERILRALASASGNRTQAARRLGMSRQSLHERLRRFGIGSGAGRPHATDAASAGLDEA